MSDAELVTRAEVERQRADRTAKSNADAALHAALAAASADMPSISKDKKANAGQYSYTYADLGSVIDAVRPVLAKHGLAYVQDVSGLPDGRIGITTIIVHRDGGKIATGPLPMPGSNDPQKVGSAITYGRRYALLAALGLATEDDDGAAARKPDPPQADPVRDLYDRIAKAGGGDKQLAAAIKAECEQWGCKFTLSAFRDGGEKLHKALERLVEEWPHMVDAAVDERTVA